MNHLISLSISLFCNSCYTDVIAARAVLTSGHVAAGTGGARQVRKATTGPPKALGERGAFVAGHVAEV